jgi:F-type H+-transporting ATPase subunit b
MPQLDLSTYSSQIFWLIICFSVIYLSFSLIIIPRIKSIIDNRNSLIAKNKNKSQLIEDEVNKIESTAEVLKEEANELYKNKIENAAVKSKIIKTQMIEEMKEKIDEDIEKSNNELQKFFKENQISVEEVSQKISQIISKKLFIS